MYPGDPRAYGAAPGVSVSMVPDAQLDPCAQDQLDVLEGQRRLTSWPYYSTVKFLATRTGTPPGPYTYDIPAGAEVRAFAYRVGIDKRVAGYTLGDGNATFADTNLQQASQTIGGQNVLVHGLAIQIVPAGLHLNDGQAVPHRVRLPDQTLLAALYEAVAVTLSLNGDENQFRLGTIGLIPGAGGLIGSNGANLIGQAPAADGGRAAGIGHPTNGWATRSNFFKVPEGLIWRNQSNADSQLNLVFNVNRAIRVVSGGSPENNVAVSGVDTAGVYLYPTELFVELKIFLVGQVVGPRTRSA